MKRSAWRPAWLPALIVMIANAAWAADIGTIGGMEADADGDGVADGWTGEVHRPEGAEGSFALDREAPHFGQACQRIDHTSANTAWVRVNSSDLPVQGGRAYRVSVHAKGSARVQVIAYEYRADGTYKPHHIEPGQTDDWHEYAANLALAGNATHLRLSLIAASQGSAWFDTVTLTPIDSPVVGEGEAPSTTEVQAPDETGVPARIVARPAAVPPAIDGVLDDAAWLQAEAVTDFRLRGAPDQAPQAPASARLAYDTQNLYIAFECAEPEMGHLVAQLTQRDSPVYTEDCIELGLARSRKSTSVFHIAVNAAGGVYDARQMGAGGLNVSWHRPPREDALDIGWDAQAEVAVSKRPDAWTVEMALPFAAIGGKPTRAEDLALNLGRQRYGVREDSAWQAGGGAFLAASSFGIVELTGAPKAEIVYVARPAVDPRSPDARPQIIPRPRNLTWTGDVMPISPDLRVVISQDAAPTLRRLAADLADHLADVCGIGPALVEGAPQPTADAIALQLTPEGGAEDAYRLVVSEGGAFLSASTVSGLACGVQTLGQLLTPSFIWGVEVSDGPDLPLRACALETPTRNEISSFREALDLLAALKFNAVLLLVDDRMQYASHPSIARPDALTPAEMRALVTDAADRGIRIIPQLSCLTHVGYILRVPEFADLAELTADGVPIPDIYCPSAPEVYELLFDLLDEIIAVLEPDMVHLGHRPLVGYAIGTDQRCEGKAPHELFARDVARLAGKLAQHGITTAIDAGFLLDEIAAGRTIAAEMVPKGVVMFVSLDSPGPEHPALSALQGHGFAVVGHGPSAPMAAYQAAGACARGDALGYVLEPPVGCARWTVTPEALAGLVIAAEQSWSAGAPTLETWSPLPTDQVERLVEGGAPDRGDHFGLVDLTEFANARLDDARWIGRGAEHHLGTVPMGLQWLGELPFLIADGPRPQNQVLVLTADRGDVLGIPVGLRASSVHVLALVGQKEPTEEVVVDPCQEPVLSVVLRYVDGTSETVELRHRRDLVDWNSRLGPAAGHAAWQGLSPGGARIVLSSSSQTNPSPDKAVEAIDLLPLSDAHPVTLLALTLTVAGQE